MKLEYIAYDIPNPAGVRVEDTFENFLSRMPNYGLLISKGKVFPPLKALNELLAIGKADAGMSGVFEWVEFQIDSNQHAEALRRLEEALGAKLDCQAEADFSLDEWFNHAVEIARQSKEGK